MTSSEADALYAIERALLKLTLAVEGVERRLDAICVEAGNLGDIAVALEDIAGVAEFMRKAKE